MYKEGGGDTWNSGGHYKKKHYIQNYRKMEQSYEKRTHWHIGKRTGNRYLYFFPNE